MNNYNVQRKYIHQFKEPARHDPYRSQIKPKGMPHCPLCRSVSVQGRWVSEKQIKELDSSFLSQVTGNLKCPACRQAEDRFALGVVELHGEKWRDKKDLVMNTIKNTEQISRYRNDQERILWINEMEKEDLTKVYVSLPELARSIGRELEKSFQGVAEYKHSSEEPFLRVKVFSKNKSGAK